MTRKPVNFIGGLDDARGLTVDIYQDHAGVRIDTGGIEIMLTAADVAVLQEHLLSALVAAAGYEVWEAALDD